MTTSSNWAAAGGAPQRRAHAGGIVFRAALCFAALLGASWIERRVLLRDAAALWIVSDDPVPADAAAVLGGGLEYRPFAAAAYYRGGLVPKILVSNVAASPAERLGVLQSHVEANEQVLRRLGVPVTAIETFGADLKDTYDEVVALHAWARRTGARAVIVPTDAFAARRLRWILQRVFGRDAVTLVPALDVPDYYRASWWKSESGVVTFQNEIVKYFFYRLKY